MTPITEIPISTLDEYFPEALTEAFAGAPSGEVVASLLTAVGESPEALRGLLLGLSSALACIKVAVEVSGSEVSGLEIGVMLSAALWALERTPEYTAAVAILEGTPS